MKYRIISIIAFLFVTSSVDAREWYLSPGVHYGYTFEKKNTFWGVQISYGWARGDRLEAPIPAITLGLRQYNESDVYSYFDLNPHIYFAGIGLGVQKKIHAPYDLDNIDFRLKLWSGMSILATYDITYKGMNSTVLFENSVGGMVVVPIVNRDYDFEL